MSSWICRHFSRHSLTVTRPCTFLHFDKCFLSCSRLLFYSLQSQAYPATFRKELRHMTCRAGERWVSHFELTLGWPVPEMLWTWIKFTLLTAEALTLLMNYMTTYFPCWGKKRKRWALDNNVVFDWRLEFELLLLSQKPGLECCPSVWAVLYSEFSLAIKNSGKALSVWWINIL